MNKKLVINNAKWIILCKIAQSLLQFIVGMLSARYLGPSNYGIINYATSIMAFTLPIMKLGFDATIVYELVKEPHKEGEIMGTSITMNIISSIVCYGGIFAFVSTVNHNDPVVIVVCILHATALVFAACEMMQYWFQYKLWSKYTSIVMLFSYAIVSAYKIFLLATGKNVYWFALAHSLEYGIIGIALIVIFFRKCSTKICFSFKRAKSMFSKSKHYIIASLMIIICQHTDHIMLTNMVSEEENGFYSAAITATIVAQFVYYAIVDSFRPLILENREKNNLEQFNLNMARLFGIIVYLSLIQSILLIVFAPLVINILYGQEYQPSIKVLQILAMYYVFAMIGVVRNVWILAEQKQKYLLGINITGAAMNVVLNAILIPYFGACGAAFASMVSQFFMNCVLSYIIKPIREVNNIMFKGLNPKFFFTELSGILKTFIPKKIDK